MALQGRVWKDHALRLVFSILARGGSLRPLRIDAPRMVRALDSVVPTVQTAAHETDALLEAEDGSVWHLEFQFGGGQEQVRAGFGTTWRWWSGIGAGMSTR